MRAGRPLIVALPAVWALLIVAVDVVTVGEVDDLFALGLAEGLDFGNAQPQGGNSTSRSHAVVVVAPPPAGFLRCALA